MAELLQEAPLDAAHRAQVDIIIRSGETLLELINEILDFSKINSGQLALEETPFDLHELMSDLIGLLGVNAKKRGLDLIIEFEPQMPRCYLGDPTRVRQVLTNLLGNAIKFTETGTVRLRARRGSTASSLAIEVSDSGVGIPPERLDAIFDPFEQADRTTTRNFGGTGLGLAISRKLAVLMGGDLSVDSTPGVGSTFTLQLVLPSIESVPEAKGGTDVLPSYGMHGLLVEDQRVNQLVARKLFLKLGITVDMAENGIEAVAKVDPEKHAVVFMDLHMPEMNGWDATREIRARGGKFAEIPIIALTADADLETGRRVLAEGMDAHLPKPLRISDVVATLEGLEIGAHVSS